MKRANGKHTHNKLHTTQIHFVKKKKLHKAISQAGTCHLHITAINFPNNTRYYLRKSAHSGEHSNGTLLLIGFH